MNEPLFWTTADLERLGMTQKQIRQKLREGSLMQLRWGAYCLPGETTPEQRHERLILATLPYVDPRNVFSHTSAAVLHGLPVPRESLGVATMIRRSSGHGNGDPHLRVRNTRISSHQITEIDGLKVTSLARTVCDQARLEPFKWGVATVDAALRRGLSREALRAELARFPRLSGVARAREVIQFADGRAESPAESISRVTMASFKLPPPVLQFEVFDENGEFVGRPDFGWPDHGLLGEVDGEVKYNELLRPGETVSHAVMREKKREQRLRRLGWWIVRWGWAEANDGNLLVPIIRDGFRNARPPRVS